MHRHLASVVFAAGLFFAAAVQAEAQTQTPSSGAAPTVTATCKDGTEFSGHSKSGACRGHGGVKSWGTAAAAPAAAGSTANAPPATSGAQAAAAKPGGGHGQVWVNTASKVYHCEGDRYYGKTKQGEYMTEQAAKAAGAHPSGGKACS